MSLQTSHMSHCQRKRRFTFSKPFLPRVRMELFEVTKGKILEGLKLYRPKGYKLTHREESRSDFSYEGKPVLLSPPVIDTQASLKSCNANFPRLNNPCETFP